MMKYDIKITRTSNSKLSSLDFNNIPFGKVFSDHMFVADFADGEWKDLRIVPFAPFEMHPANMTLHYAQTIFEGMNQANRIKEEMCFTIYICSQRKI